MPSFRVHVLCCAVLISFFVELRILRKRNMRIFRDDTSCTLETDSKQSILCPEGTQTAPVRAVAKRAINGTDLWKQSARFYTLENRREHATRKTCSSDPSFQSFSTSQAQPVFLSPHTLKE
ncbi:hypothetical protein HDK77DRAFT_445567 [Phyllosticta capitalensis]